MQRLNLKLRRSLAAIHHFLGQAAAAIVVILASTGIAMNHEDDIDYLKGSVRWEPLLDWYGVAPKGDLIQFTSDGHSGASLERGIYLDGRYLTATESPLVGVVRFQRFLALAARDRLWLVDPAPSLTAEPVRILDQLDSASLPVPLTRLGRSRNEELVVGTGSGDYKTDADLLNWEPAGSVAVTWSTASPASEELRKAVLREFRGDGLPRKRVLADLHSGRIIGGRGPWLIDAFAVILLLLAVTGLVSAGLGRGRRNRS